MDIPRLTHDCDYRDWVRMVKYTLRLRGSIELIEKDEGHGVGGTKREKATWESVAKKEKMYVLGCCLSAKVRKNVLLFPLTTTVRQIWHAIRKEILGLTHEEQYALLFTFLMQSSIPYPSAEEFLEAIDDRWEHLARHFPFPLSITLRLTTALLGIKNHDETLYTGLWKSLDGIEPSYQLLKDYVERESEADFSVFETTENPKDVISMSKVLSKKCKNKSR